MYLQICIYSICCFLYVYDNVYSALSWWQLCNLRLMQGESSGWGCTHNHVIVENMTDKTDGLPRNCHCWNFLICCRGQHLCQGIVRVRQVEPVSEETEGFGCVGHSEACRELKRQRSYSLLQLWWSLAPPAEKVTDLLSAMAVTGRYKGEMQPKSQLKRWPPCNETKCIQSHRETPNPTMFEIVTKNRQA